MSTDHSDRSNGGQPNPDAWIMSSPRKAEVKRTRLRAWMAEIFIVRGRDLALIAVVFGLAGLVAGILGGQL